MSRYIYNDGPSYTLDILLDLLSHVPNDITRRMSLVATLDSKIHFLTQQYQQKMGELSLALKASYDVASHRRVSHLMLTINRLDRDRFICQQEKIAVTEDCNKFLANFLVKVDIDLQREFNRIYEDPTTEPHMVQSQYMSKQLYLCAPNYLPSCRIEDKSYENMVKTMEEQVLEFPDYPNGLSSFSEETTNMAFDEFTKECAINAQPHSSAPSKTLGSSTIRNKTAAATRATIQPSSIESIELTPSSQIPMQPQIFPQIPSQHQLQSQSQLQAVPPPLPAQPTPAAPPSIQQTFQPALPPPLLQAPQPPRLPTAPSAPPTLQPFPAPPIIPAPTTQHPPPPQPLPIPASPQDPHLFQPPMRLDPPPQPFIPPIPPPSFTQPLPQPHLATPIQQPTQHPFIPPQPLLGESPQHDDSLLSSPQPAGRSRGRNKSHKAGAASTKSHKRASTVVKKEEPKPSLPVVQSQDAGETELWCWCQRSTTENNSEMIGCDNDRCRFEWYHLSCVGLNHAPDGDWECDICKGGSYD